MGIWNPGLLVLLIISLGVSVFVALYRRRAMEIEPEPDAALELQSDDVLVIPQRQSGGDALVLGSETALARLEQAGLTRSRSEARPLDQLLDVWVRGRSDVALTRARSVADRPLEGAYLRLSEESRRELAHGKPVLTRTGEMLGVLNDPSGKRRHILRFTDARRSPTPVSSWLRPTCRRLSPYRLSSKASRSG
jgi:hypothetical protein